MSSNRSPGVPGVGNDPRDRIAESHDPPDKTWFRDLDEAVIEADRCVKCGSCMAACPSDSIGIEEETGRPTLVRMCTGCSRCWDFCPRSGLRSERLNELEGATVSTAYATEAAGDHTGQNGGAVTALLAGLFEAGEIDGAIVVGDADEPLRGEAILATSREELLASAGSNYNQTMQLGQVDELVGSKERVALVGTPCVVQGATALDRLQYDDELESVVLRIALVCTRSFVSDRLRAQLLERDVDLEAVEHISISGGVLSAIDGDGTILFEEDVDAFQSAALRGCAECSDALGKTADISAGNVGSPDGTTTLLVRTDAGQAAIDAARDELVLEELEGTDAIAGFDAWNRREASAALPRELDPDGDLSITYAEHRDAYDGTDREPQALNPARVHQYEEWC